MEEKSVHKWTGRRVLLAVVLTALMSGGFVWAIVPRTVVMHSDANPRVNVFLAFEKYGGSAELEKVVGLVETHNVITDIGEAQCRNRFSQNGTYVALYWLSIGNATAGTSLTQLTTEHDRQKGTIAEWINAGDYALNVTYKWEFTGDVALNCAGGHWVASGDNNMYSVANFPDGEEVFHNGENLTARFIYTFNAN